MEIEPQMPVFDEQASEDEIVPDADFKMDVEPVESEEEKPAARGAMGFVVD
jgi:hypothetical protein